MNIESRQYIDHYTSSLCFSLCLIIKRKKENKKDTYTQKQNQQRESLPLVNTHRAQQFISPGVPWAEY